MARLTLSRVTMRYGDDVTAVDDVSLCFPSGQITALLGPSGCGKTTLLRIIAGLEQQTRGAVMLSGVDISTQSASERRFGMVFQSFALFPHLNVEDNIAYSLSINKVSVEARRRRAAELLDMVKLSGYGKRRIGELSGGQRQRVAIARALAQNPRVFLLDEPMSALDAQLREQMQVELRLLQQQLGITTIVVTHDQREAMTMADKVVVMSGGSVEQIGSPHEIYNKPSSQFVASFIGQNNFLDGVVGQGCINIDGHSLYLNESIPFLSGSSVRVACRPEVSRVRRVSDFSGLAFSRNCLPGRVTLVREVGPVREVFLDVGGQQILCVESGTARDLEPLVAGEDVSAQLPEDSLQVFPRERVA